jgi:hypothetical protein
LARTVQSQYDEMIIREAEDFIAMRRFRHLPGLLIVVLALALQVCGGGSSNTGSGPTGPAPVPVPTPEPTPVGDPPLSAACARMGDGVPHNQTTCRDEAPSFLSEVDEAIRILQSERPEIFDRFRVLEVSTYIVEVIRILDERMNLCADYDGEELGVASSSEFNDQYDILSSRDDYRTGSRTYLGTCYPSVVPRPVGQLPPSHAGCPLPPSTLVACGRSPAGGQYYGDVEAAIDQLLEERPELFDPSDYARGQGWPALRDPAAYHEAMVDLLRDKGYCAIFDGEEIQMKRGSNEFSEHYDVNYQDRYVRKGSGIFRGTCRPAAF